MDRTHLPYRRNCEGYFVYKNKYVLARNTGLGYIEFPGGGVEGGDVKEAMHRETLEETGATIKDMKLFKKVYFDWSTTWAKTDKQKLRYEKFRGEEMDLFIGEVNYIGIPIGDPEAGEEGWKGKPYIETKILIGLVEGFRPYTPEMNDYHETQLKILRSFL